MSHRNQRLEGVLHLAILTTSILLEWGQVAILPLIRIPTSKSTYNCYWPSFYKLPPLRGQRMVSELLHWSKMFFLSLAVFFRSHPNSECAPWVVENDVLLVHIILFSEILDMERNALIQPDFILDMQRKVLNIPKHFLFSSACLFSFRAAFKILPAMALSKKYIMKVKTTGSSFFLDSCPLLTG